MGGSAIGHIAYALAAAALVALAATVKTDGYVANILMQATTYAIAVFGLSIVLGLCGQINLAQAAFFALGAYCVGLGTADYHLPFWLCLAGGVALAFHPTLYAPPFLINWLAPEALTAPILRFFFADRHDAECPKFPARYDLCTAEPGVVEPALRRAGFRQVLSAPFWGDRYFRHLPGLREMNDALSAFAEARDWRRLASYAYTIAAK